MAEWCPFAIRRDGPFNKQGYSGVSAHRKRGQVNHSAEGYWPGIYQVLDSVRQVSWHFTIGYDRIEQHYPVSSDCWHAGDADNDDGVAANIDLIGIEHLGRVGEPLTEYQIDANVRLTKWLSENAGITTTYARFPEQYGVWTLVEHNQVGDLRTDCPSGRIPWDEIMERLAPTPPYGIRVEPPYVYIDVQGIGVIRIGDENYMFPGQIAKLFGDKWMWLRTGPRFDSTAVMEGYLALWSPNKGD